MKMGDVELLVCHRDEEAEPPRLRRTVTPRYFRGTRRRPVFGFDRSKGLDLKKGDFFLVRAVRSR
jgi:hypothetical protein